METLVEESPNPNWPVEEAHWLTATRSHIAQLAQQGQDPRFVFHNDRLSYHLEQTVGLLESSDSSTGSPRLTVHLAALFYPMGFAREATEPLAESQALARRFLLRAGLPAEKVEEVGRIMHEAHRQHPQTAGSSYLADALLGLRCPRADETDWPSLAQLEVELIKDTHDRVGWQQQELQELLTLCFHTSAGRQRWQEALGQRILAQRRKLEKARRNQSTPTQAGNGSGAFGPLEEGPAARGAQTFFRAVFRNHINLSAIADNKANIMISVNSILISVLITFLSYRNIAETQPLVLMPVVVFLVSGLASLVFAVLSARPKVTNLNQRQPDPEQQRRNLAFFGNFITLKLEDYEAAMEEVLQDSDLLYGNLVRDLYHLGKVLDKKYRYLTISYNIFMVGLIITVGLFLFTLLNPSVG